jgi:hypothetical protein
MSWADSQTPRRLQALSHRVFSHAAPMNPSEHLQVPVLSLQCPRFEQRALSVWAPLEVSPFPHHTGPEGQIFPEQSLRCHPSKQTHRSLGPHVPWPEHFEGQVPETRRTGPGHATERMIAQSQRHRVAAANAAMSGWSPEGVGGTGDEEGKALPQLLLFSPNSRRTSKPNNARGDWKSLRFSRFLTTHFETQTTQRKKKYA